MKRSTKQSKMVVPFGFKGLVLQGRLRLSNVMKQITTATYVLVAKVGKSQIFLSLVMEKVVNDITIFLVWILPWNVCPQEYGFASYVQKRGSSSVYIQSVRESNLCGMSRRECRTPSNIL
uniref:Uncharacterized protein n=1 Tax=Arundo donax TaxID=35708 RepID=A0A0A9GYS0_ARUDO